MFLENAKASGSIEVICGSMFSGKTEELIRRIRRAQFANQKIAIFKPCIDTRYSDEDVVSHDLKHIPSFPVDSPEKILNHIDGIEVVGIDEAQFFGSSIVDVATKLADSGIRVIIAGLDTDFLGKPFGPMPALMAVASSHTACPRAILWWNWERRIFTSRFAGIATTRLWLRRNKLPAAPAMTK